MVSLKQHTESGPLVWAQLASLPQIATNTLCAHFHPSINMHQYFPPFCLLYIAGIGLGTLLVGSQFSHLPVQKQLEVWQTLFSVTRVYSKILFFAAAPASKYEGKLIILPSSNRELCYKLITDSSSVPAGLQHRIWSPPLRLLVSVWGADW